MAHIPPNYITDNNARIDENNVPTLLGVSNVDEQTTVPIYADPVTHALLIDTI